MGRKEKVSEDEMEIEVKVRGRVKSKEKGSKEKRRKGGRGGGATVVVEGPAEWFLPHLIMTQSMCSVRLRPESVTYEKSGNLR